MMTVNSMHKSRVRSRRSTQRLSYIALGATLAVVFAAVILSVLPKAFGTEPAVELGAAKAYSVLAGETVTNTGATVLSNNLGLSPGSAIVGFPPGIVMGEQHAADVGAALAKSSLTAAYNDAAGRTSTATTDGALGGKTLAAGTYASSASISITGTLTLDGGGDANAVFIFQSPSTLITAPASSIVLTGDAQACNVFWQVTSSATLDTSSSFKGTIMALTSISANTGAAVEGRLLARNGEVTLQGNKVNTPECAPPTTDPTTTGPTPSPTDPTPTPTEPTSSPTPTATPTPSPTPRPPWPTLPPWPW